MRLDKFRGEENSLQQMLDVFLDIPAIKKRTSSSTSMSNIAQWQLNFGSKWDIPRSFDGAMLIGDAAGLINPLTGGGIHNGIISAKLAATAAHKALLSQDYSKAVFKEFEDACTKSMEKGMKSSFLIQRTLLTMPMIVDLLIRWGSSNGDLAQTFVNKL